MVYLIGVRHAVQYERTPPFSYILQEAESVRDKRADFKAHVSEAINKFGIELLAEEASDEIKKTKWHVTETVLEQFSKAKGIDYRACDPDSIEKVKHGIDDDEKRERFWLDQIGDCKHRRVLFVCGDDHFDSFAAKLSASGFDVLLGARWQMS